MDLSNLFSYFSIITVFLPFAYCIYVWRKKGKDRLLLGLSILLCTSIISELSYEIYVRLGYRGMIIYNLWFVAQFMATSYIYQQLLGEKFSKLINSGRILFLTIFAGITAFNKEQHIQAAQSWVWMASGLIIIVYGVVHILYLSKTLEREPPLLQYGPFWISGALITYFTYSTTLFFMANRIFAALDPATILMVWNFHNLNYILRNILLTIAIRQKAKGYKHTGIDYYKEYGINRNWRENLSSPPDL